MPIVGPTPPAGVTNEFSTNLPTFLSGLAPTPAFPIKQQGALGRAPLVPSFGEVSADPLHDPQPVYVLDLRTPTLPQQPAFWRLFAGTEQYSSVMGRMTQKNAADPWKMTAAYYGDRTANRDRVWSILQATAALTSLPEVQSHDYELRVLAVPAINLEAFWLVRQGGGGPDLVVPFPETPNQPIPALNTARSYSMETFLQHIIPLAHHTAAAAHPHTGG